MSHQEDEKNLRAASQLAKQEGLTHQQKMMRGTAWLSVGQLVSRLMGALYIIPWATWLGQNFSIANALFGIAYVPYALFIEMSTAGFPAAMTKQISQLNAQNEYRAGLKLFMNCLYLMSGMGIISFIVFYLIAPAIAANSPSVNDADAIVVLRSLAPALILLPPLSLMRGFFQGYQQMAASAISQLLEQFVRVAYLLGATFVILKLTGGTMVQAVAHSTFAAFIGAVIAVVYMCYTFYRERHYIRERAAQSANTIEISFKDSVLAMLKDSIPFVLLGIGFTVTVLVDQFSFSQIMTFATNLPLEQIMVEFAIFSQNVNKIISIISALTVAMTGAAIPLIASLFQKREQQELTKVVANNIQLYLFLMLPAAIGLFVVARPIYMVFYPDDLGAGVLRLSCLTTIIVGFNGLLANALQAMGRHDIALKCLGVAIYTKAMLQFPFVYWLHGYGAVAATGVAFGVSSFLLWQALRGTVHFNQRFVLRRAVLIVGVTAMMALACAIILTLSDAVLPGDSRLVNLVKLVVVAAFGASVYGYIMLKIRMVDKVFGSVAENLRRKLRIS